jgi:hypothetical protein
MLVADMGCAGQGGYDLTIGTSERGTVSWMPWGYVCPRSATSQASNPSRRQ